MAGENLAKRPVLMGLVTCAGLDPEAGKKVLDQRLYQKAVEADWELSRAKGVQAVPTFFMGLDRLVGAQPPEVLERLVVKSGAVKRGATRKI